MRGGRRILGGKDPSETLLASRGESSLFLGLEGSFSLAILAASCSCLEGSGEGGGGLKGGDGESGGNFGPLIILIY